MKLFDNVNFFNFSAQRNLCYKRAILINTEMLIFQQPYVGFYCKLDKSKANRLMNAKIDELVGWNGIYTAL